MVKIETNFGLESRIVDLEKINPNITKGVCEIAYTGHNRKKFDISEEVFKDAFDSLKGSPVVAHFFYDRKDDLQGQLGGHEDDVLKSQNGYVRTGRTYAYGFVDYTTEPYIKEKDDNKWICANVYLWTGRFPEAEKILESSQSMECSFSGVSKNNEGYLVPKKMEFLALCALNKEKVEPVFIGSEFTKFSMEDVRKDIQVMKEEFSNILFAKDDPKTPAKPSERIRGSKKNKEGSASTKGSKIKLTESIITSLENKAKEHNDTVKYDDSKKATLSDLKKVYRRGAGAYSSSHRPSVTSRNQWAMARVNAYLYLLKNGKPKDSKYITDNDLLPKDHPKKSTKMSCDRIHDILGYLEDEFSCECDEGDIEDLLEELEDDFATPKKYEDIDFVPPKGVAEAAQRGLDMRSRQTDSNKCCTPVGLARARQLVNRQKLSPSTIRRMLSYFQRHEVDKQGKDWNNESKGKQAWDIWGGDPGYSWAKKVVSQMDKADEKMSIMDEDFAIERAVEDDIKIDTSKDKTIDGIVGEKDVAELKKRIIRAKNYKSLIPKVFLKVPDSLDEFNMSDLGYPVMYFRDGVLYYHLGFIKAASSRIEAQKDQPYYQEVRYKLEKVRKKVGMPEKFSEVSNYMKKMMAMKGKFMDMYKKMAEDKVKYAVAKDGDVMYAMDESACYAMDMKEGKYGKVPYAMKEEEFAMDEEKMEEAEFAKEMMGMMNKFMEDMKISHSSEMENMKSDKDKFSKDLERAGKDLEISKKELEVVEGKFSTLEKDLEAKTIEAEGFKAEIATLKLQDEAKEMINKSFSFLSIKEREEVMGKISNCENIEDFEREAKLFSFDKIQKSDKFSMMSVEGLDSAKEEKGSLLDKMYKK